MFVAPEVIATEPVNAGGLSAITSTKEQKVPKKKSIRRFEPRFGVTRLMIETEAKALAREAEEYHLRSITELNDVLRERRKAWKQADDTLRQILDGIADREHLALQCLLFRDFYHMLELYLEHARAQPLHGLQRAAHVTADAEMTPFSESLFPAV
jgi:hypothetical protein